MMSFPFCAHLQERDVFFDRPATEHLIRRHGLCNRPALRQFRRQFENVLGAANVAQAVAFVEHKLGSLVPAAQKLLEIVADDTSYWVSYRRETDAGEYLNRRLNIFLACGLIVVMQIEQNDWHLRSAFFTAERNKVHESRREAIQYAIRNQIGKYADGRLEFVREHRYRGKLNDIYTVQTDFELSDPGLFGVRCSAEAAERRYFDLNRVLG